LPVIGDVSNEEDVARLVDTTISNFGHIDILVNNAGISPKKDGRKPLLTEIPLQEWKKVIDVNLTSMFICCKAVLPTMIKQKSGRIVNLSSSAALDGGFLAGAHYTASKGGVSALTMSLAREVAPNGITVNAVAPGRIITPMASLTSDEKNREALSRIPVGRFGKPEDVANIILFLASEKTSFMTGVTVNVSGGYVIS